MGHPLCASAPVFRVTRTALIAWSLASALFVSSPAAAQSAPEPQHAADEEARAHFYAGQAAFEAGRYAVALACFERAYELSHRPALLYNIAIAADRLRRDERAIEAFEQYLREAAPDAPQRSDVEARLRALRDAHGERVPGFTITVEEDAAIDPPPAIEATPSAPEPSIVPWIVIGASGAVAVAGGVLLALGIADSETVNGAPAGTPWTEVSGAAERAGWMTPTGIALLGAGLAGAAAGVVWWILDQPGPGEERIALRVHVGLASIGVSGEL